MEKIKILVCAHKKDIHTRQGGIYMPIQAGKAISNIDLGFQGDDTGENISSKNPEYSEQTVLYWAWKNLRDVEYIGLNHYRRYFNVDITKDNINELMRGYDIIVGKPQVHNYANHLFFEAITSVENMYILLKVIDKLYPQYHKAMVDYFYNSNKWIMCSMFVCKRDLFEDYATFLFNTLGEAEKYVRSTGYYSRYRRSIGYIGEVLLPIYCYANNLKIKYLPIIKVDTNINTKETLRSKMHNFKTNLLFRMQQIRKYKELPELWDTILNSLKQDNINI